MSAVYGEGFDAARNQEPPESCPYPPSVDRETWLIGHGDGLVGRDKFAEPDE